MSQAAAPFGQVEGADAGPGIVTIIGPCSWVPAAEDGIWGALMTAARPWLHSFVSVQAEMNNAAIKRELNLLLTRLELAGEIPTLNNTPVQAKVWSRGPGLSPTTADRAVVDGALWESFRIKLIADPRATLAFVRSARPDLYRQLVDEVTSGQRDDVGGVGRDGEAAECISDVSVNANDGEVSGLIVDEATFTVRYRGRECSLGNTNPFRLLKRLNRRPGHFVTYEGLLEDVWGGGTVTYNTIQQTVRTLRQKLEHAQIEGVLIESQRSAYRLQLT